MPFFEPCKTCLFDALSTMLATMISLVLTVNDIESLVRSSRRVRSISRCVRIAREVCSLVTIAGVS